MIGRIDHVFVHALFNRQRLFLIITKVTQTAAMDQILGLPMLDTQNKQELIGLPAVAGRKLYIVPVIQVEEGLQFVPGSINLLHVDWQIQFL